VTAAAASGLGSPIRDGPPSRRPRRGAAGDRGDRRSRTAARL